MVTRWMLAVLAVIAACKDSDKAQVSGSKPVPASSSTHPTPDATGARADASAPAPADAGEPVVDQWSTERAPEPAGPAKMAPIGDFWVTPRKDGSVSVANATFEIAFREEPELELRTQPNLTKDGHPIRTYTAEVDPDGIGLWRFELVALGRGAQDLGVVPQIKQELAKLGNVTEAPFDAGALQGTELVVNGEAEGTRLSKRVRFLFDSRRGLEYVLTAVGREASADEFVTARFFASFRVLAPADPLDEIRATSEIAIDKVKKRFRVRDKAGLFEMTLPMKPEITGPARGKVARIETVITAPGKWSGFGTFAIYGLAPWDALSITDLATVVGAEPGKAKLTNVMVDHVPALKVDITLTGIRTHMWYVMNEFQHRMYILMCVDACTKEVASIRFTKSVPP